jgi:hypothetical protein
MGFGLVIGFTDHSQVVNGTKYNTLADSRTTNHSTLNLLSVLSLVFTIRFLATDLSQSHCNFKYHCNYNTCKVFNSNTKFSWHSLLLSTFPEFRSTTVSILTQFLTTHFIFFWLDTTLELFRFPNELPERARVRVTLRLAVCRQLVRLRDKPLETHDQ